jgi:hypothetical protein
MRLYAYCVSLAADPEPRLSGTGVLGRPVWTLEDGSLRALVSDVGEENVAPTRENALAHARIVERVLAATTPIPFRFGAILSKERLLEHLRHHEERLRERLLQVRGCVELSVKVLWDPEQVRQAESPAPVVGHVELSEAVGPGARFLAAVREQVEGEEALRTAAELVVAWLETAVADLTHEHRNSTSALERLAVRLALLVPRDRMDECRERLRALGDERPDLQLLVSGPWAPYSFSDL